MAVSQARIIESLEQACSSITPSEFIFDFLDAYGFPKSTITRLRNGDDNRNVGEGNDVALKKKVYFRTIEVGNNVGEEAEVLRVDGLIKRNDIRFVMVTDYETLVAFDLLAEERIEIPLCELDKNYAFFLPLAGYEKAVMYSEHPADVKASSKMGELFDLIRQRNDLSKPEDIHALNVFLTRLLFCFYAEDTGIFNKDQLTSTLQSTTQDDGSDVDQFFFDLFTIMNLDDNDPKRKAMPSHFQAFPYVNGGLFRDDEPIPEFGRKARRLLIDCGSLNWSDINPDIFGSMFQAVIDEDQRGNLGQHYTSVSNIMKVISPLFLDKLYAELNKVRGSEKKLKDLLVRLQRIRVFDAACGSGNFLIIAYKELRKFEMLVIDALNEASNQVVMYASGIRLSQFYGIEIDDFAHEIATLSLWLTEHQMNMAFKAKFGYTAAVLPLRNSGHIVCGNALKLDWREVCPNKDLEGNEFEVYICGNPPFLGKSNQTREQRQYQSKVTDGIKAGSDLDFVACWFLLAAKYIQYSPKTSAAFVATNSITQGEQASILWKELFRLDIQIHFAFATFVWSSAARNKAAVHCIIVGFGRKDSEWPKYLFGNGFSKVVKNISPYIIEASDTVIEKRRRPLCSAPLMSYGNKPTDDGNLILNDNEREELIKQEPGASKWIRKFIGAKEFINGTCRWCLWLKGITQKELDEMPLVNNRVKSVREFRLKSTASPTVRSANSPESFFYTSHPETNYIVIPETSSERREYLPIGYADQKTISSNAIYMISEPNLYVFGVLNSSMHNDWMRTVTGRLKSDYRYSATLVYNTFPWPIVEDKGRSVIEALAEEVLLIREDYLGKSLADLYDPEKMPEPLREAHKDLDIAVERLYREKPFRDTSERLEHLFNRYEKLIAEEKQSNQ